MENVMDEEPISDRVNVLKICLLMRECNKLGWINSPNLIICIENLKQMEEILNESYPSEIFAKIYIFHKYWEIQQQWGDKKSCKSMSQENG